MDLSKIVEVLQKVKSDNIDINSAAKVLAENSFEPSEEELFAKIDYSRIKRCGFPEFVYGAGKSLENLKSIIKRIHSNNQPVLVTRLLEDVHEKLMNDFPNAFYDKQAKTFILKADGKAQKTYGKVVVITAGTSDIPVALEAKYTAELCGCGVETVFDVGVAGIHRLLSNIDKIRDADVIICAAGMEGALPSVVAGLVPCPVIAVPTSVGYGASLKGLTAMFAMLNSCANGVLVVNIDNGFGAGCAAARVIDSLRKKHE